MATTYRIRFNNFEEQAVECTLTDETSDLDIIDIEGAEDAIRIVSQDNDESKFSPIKAKKCVIKFLNSQSVNLRTFATGEDSKWLVTVKINSLTVFIGHLEQGDIEEPFQYEENQIVTLTATDGLGVLKTHRLEDVYDVWTPGPTNENRIIDYIAACLGVTGLRLTINVINNLREEDFPDTDVSNYGNIYAVLFLDIKTFENDKIGKYINSYEVLEKILGHDCYLTQAKGEWWIVRVKELRPDFDMKKTVFDFDGTVLSFETLNYEKAIGLKDVSGTPFAASPDASAFFSQDKTIVSLLRPVKYVTLRYNYDNFLETLCNQSLQRGNFIADLPDEVDGDGHTLTVKSYDLDCWEYDKEEPPTTQDSDAYVKVRYLSGIERERYIHMDSTSVDDTYYYKCLQRIPIGLGDKVNINYAVRWGTDLGGAKPYTTQDLWIRLYGDDGSFWNFGFFPPNVGFKWWVSNSAWSLNVADRGLFVDDTVDMLNWTTNTVEVSPAPVSGRLEILLLNKDQPSSQSKEYSSLDLEYIPYIAGSYNIFSSQTDTSTRDGSYFSSIEDEVFISNSPRPIFKGALLKDNGTNFVVVDMFYEGQEWDAASGSGHLATYGELRVRAYHQQFRNGDEIYRATCQGLTEGSIDTDSLDDHQDLIHRYFIRDIEPTTNTQAFQLVTQDVDLRNCEWTGTLIKNFDTGIGFVSDTYEFAYGAAQGTSGGGGGGGGVATSTADRFGVSGEDDTAGENRSFDMTGGDWTFSYLGDSGNTSPLITIGSPVSRSPKGMEVYADTVGGYFDATQLPLWANYSGADTNNTVTVLAVSREAGFGVAGEEMQIAWSMDDDAANVDEPMNQIAGWTSPVTTACISYYKIQLASGAGTIDRFILYGEGAMRLIPITATEASAITPQEGMMVFVNSTNGTFTSIGMWDYENSAWHKM